jgi:hypothetical protein
MMPTKVAFYTLQLEASAPELEGPMDCCEGDTCADLHVRLEAAGVLDWLFQFVGSELGKRTFEQ